MKEKLLKPFIFLGMEFEKEAGNQAIGKCIFCGKEQHFFVNQNNGLWDCKSCHRSGNLNHFLEEFWKMSLEDIKKEDYKEYEEIKNVPVPVQKKWKLGYNGLKKRYILPVRNDNNSVTNLRLLSLKQKTIGVAGCKNNILGLHHLKNSEEKIYICEGENDCLILDWLLHEIGEDGTVIALPGSFTLKKEHLDYFYKREVNICFDNDPPGKELTKKIHTTLEKIANNINILYWPDSLPIGYDLRDFIGSIGFVLERPKQAFVSLQKWLSPYKQLNIKLKDSRKIPKVTLRELIENHYAKHLKLNDSLIGAIKIALAVPISVNIPGQNPVWVHLVGPPGCGKTTILETLSACSKLCYFQSSLKSTSLISGFRSDTNVDPSILARINNRCLILKDWTEILKKPFNEREEIAGIMRGAFDGHVEKDYGNRESKSFICNFTTITGVTREIESHNIAALGERFLRYYISGNDKEFESQQEVAIHQALFGKKGLTDLKQAVSNFLLFKRDFSPEFINRLIPEWFVDRIKPLALLAGKLRTTVSRFPTGYLRDKPAYIPESETGNRLVVQLFKLAATLTLMEEKEEADKEIYELVKKVGLDTCQSISTTVIHYMIKSNIEENREQIAKGCGIPASIITPHLEDLTFLKVAENTTIKKEKGFHHPTYRISNQILKLAKRI